MLLLLLACAADPAPKQPGNTGATTPSGPSWNDEVAPIVQEHCARCHAPDQQAPDWFSDPANAQVMATQMLAAIDRGSMPPPAPDPDCRDYQGSDEHYLDDAERAVIAAWVDAGAPIEADAVGVQFVSPLPTSADLELRPPQKVKPAYDSTGNAYLCYSFDVNQDVWATEFVPLVDNPKIVHHIVVYDASSDSDLPEEGVGFECDGFGESGWEFLAGWAPGGLNVSFGDGMALRLSGGSRLVVAMHYYATNDSVEGEEDESGFGFNTADSAETEVFSYPLGVYNFRIPADDADYSRSDTTTWPSSYPAIGIVGVFPHMHQLGSGFDMGLTRVDDSEECLVRMDGWDFHNQAQAVFLEPARVEPGDKLKITCYWDNSADNPAQFNDPPEAVRLGEGSGDEMCFGFTYGFLATD